MKLTICCLRSSWVRADDDVGTFTEIWQQALENVTQPPLHSVASHSVAHGLRHNKTHPGYSGGVFPYVHDHVAPPSSFPGANGLAKILTPA